MAKSQNSFVSALRVTPVTGVSSVRRIFRKWPKPLTRVSMVAALTWILRGILPDGIFKRYGDVTGLIESLSPSGRWRLSAELAKRLRQSQQRRVMAQKAPDGTPYAPRQQQSARKRPVALSGKCLRNLSPVVFCTSAPARNRHQWNFTAGSRRKSPVCISSVCQKPGKTVRKLIIRRVLCSALPVRMCR